MSENGDLPNLGLIKQCSLGNIDLDKEEIFKIYQWYMEEIAPKVVGSKISPTMFRLHNITSKGTMPGASNNTPIYTPSSRAFIYLMCENHWAKWQAMADWKKKNGKTKLLNQPTKAQLKEEEKLPKSKRNLANNIMPMFTSKYTTASAGQAKYGGWKDSGIQRFQELEEEMVDHWKDKEKELVEFERKYLKLHQASEGIAEGSTGKKKKKKRKLDDEDGEAVVHLKKTSFAFLGK